MTTSGFFSDPALMHCIQEIGIDRILFSIDYPFVENPPGTEWAMRIPLAAADKEKILSGNAKRLLKLNLSRCESGRLPCKLRFRRSY